MNHCIISLRQLPAQCALKSMTSSKTGISICFSTAEWFIPFWNDPIPVRNESFQSGMNHSGVVPEIGYETYSQNSGSLYVSRIWRIFWSISIQCRAILNFPWFFFLIVYSGMIHSSLERNIPDWNESFQTGITYTDVVEKNPYWCYSEMLTFLSSGRESRSHSL